jgi:uncharacterized membrane protein YhaH (DUF805 family)
VSSVLNPYRPPTAAVVDGGVLTEPVKVFSVSGRIGRVRYLAYSIALYFLCGFAAMLLMFIHPVAGLLPYAVMFVHLFMLTIQRCHDFDMSGWLSLLVLVPLLNLMFLLVPGTDGANRYGGPTPPNTAGVLVLAWLFPVVAGLGVVAAIAVPAYQDYVKRAQQQVPLQKR